MRRQNVNYCILQNLKALRDKLLENDYTKAHYTRKLLSFARAKRSSSSLQDVTSYLEISELIITNTNDSETINFEKEKLIKQLKNQMVKLCNGLKTQKVQLGIIFPNKTFVNPNFLELKTLVLGVEKINQNSFNNYISIPFERNSWNSSARLKLDEEKLKNGCIGKASFKNYLGKKGIVYFVDLVNTETLLKYTVTILLPITQSNNNTRPKVKLNINM